MPFLMASLQVWFDDESEVCMPVDATFYGWRHVLSNEVNLAPYLLIGLIYGGSTGKTYGLIQRQPLEQCAWCGGLILKPNSQFYKGICPISWLLRTLEHHQLVAVDIHVEIDVLV